MNKKGSGILCFRYNSYINDIEFLLVCKTFSNEFLKIITSRYKKENLDISRISIFEAYIIKNYKIGDVAKAYFGDSSIKFKTFINKKFNDYKKYVKNLDGLLDDTYCTDCQKWEIPKGHVEAGESSKRCALREFEEESGISNGDIHMYEKFKKIEKIKYRNILYIVTYYLSKYIGNTMSDITEIGGNNEIVCSKWFNIDEIRYINIDSAKYRIILNYYKIIKKNRI